ncbi:MAG: efflux RND transporter periplasmic adaptor subunit [Syntrophaceae bacterium]|nr:efflux RND transporter periplasmic adaptor subunit [Syntrophaceae bacterium]
MGSSVPKSSEKPSKLLYIGGIVVVMAALMLIVGLWKADSDYLRVEGSERLEAMKAGYSVRTALAKLASTTRSISLIGDARPFTNVVLYAKVGGFLKTINVDKGDRVTEGQVLAVIESPELDRQYDAALADAKDKQADAQRARGLYKTGAMSLQDAERLEAAAQVSQNTAESLKAQKAYEIISAPFTGAVTARFVDPGALIQNATTTQTSAQPIVSVAQIDKLRIYVYPDQSVASLIRDGDAAHVTDPAWPDASVKGTVTRNSRELDPKTRTLLVEIDIDNHENRILAGSSVQVIVWVQTPQYVEVPAEALLIRKEKKFVGVITPDNKISFRPITIYYSDGKVLRLSSGVEEGELVAINLKNTISDGDKVHPIEEGSAEKNNKSNG